MSSPLVLVGALVALLGIYGMGCIGGRKEVQQGLPGLVEGAGPEIESLDQIGAGCPAFTKAKLTLAGDAIDVKVSCVDKQGDVKITLTAHDADFEEEDYKKTTNTFLLVNAAREIFDPPLLLARAPMHAGDKWTWSGQLSSGGIAHAAKGAITTSKERIFPPNSGAVDALRVQVDLDIDGGGPTPAKRKLLFWFAQGHGLIKRQFGETSIREPAGP